MKFDVNHLKWTREPRQYVIQDGKIEITECKWLAHDGQAHDEE